jgi:Galactose oxidase, central domain
VLCYGGVGKGKQVLSGDTHLLDLEKGITLYASMLSPVPALKGHTLTSLDSENLLLFGGLDANGCTSSTVYLFSLRQRPSPSLSAACLPPGSPSAHGSRSPARARSPEPSASAMGGINSSSGGAGGVGIPALCLPLSSLPRAISFRSMATPRDSPVTSPSPARSRRGARFRSKLCSPASSPPISPRVPLSSDWEREIAYDQLDMGVSIAHGGSGVVHVAEWQGREVVVKKFFSISDDSFDAEITVLR